MNLLARLEQKAEEWWHIIFGGAVAVWLAKTLVKAWVIDPNTQLSELRREVQTQLSQAADIDITNSTHRARAVQAQIKLREVAHRINAFTITHQKPALWLIRWRGYDLALARDGVGGVADELFDYSDVMRAFHRVRALRGLRLPVDPEDADQHDRIVRLQSATF